jgi:alpha-2-macroglobulin-like protein
MALRALLLSTEKGAADVRGAVEISLNGKPAQKLAHAGEQRPAAPVRVPGECRGGAQKRSAWSFRFEGKGGLAYQVVGRYFVPWGEKPAGERSRSTWPTTARTWRRTTSPRPPPPSRTICKTANMVMVDLGIPPGFDLLSEDLQAYQEKSRARKSGRLEKFSLTATQAILYFDSIGAGDTVTLQFRLRAKYPIRARTFQSRVYEYYDPAVSAVARPVVLEVRKRY